MMMVKSANDMAVLLAEGVSGSIDKFADQMTLTAQTLGMTESNFVNPNGLPADGQITSARDLAILARALIRDFPQDNFYWHIPAIQFGKRVVRNYNPLIGRYPGTDGMKTGFICASGFNLVATATRDNKHLIAVVLGAPSGAARAVKAAEMLEGGFTSNPLAWLMPSLGTVDQLKPIHTDPPNLKDEMCGKHRKRPAADDDDEEAGAAQGNGATPDAAAATDGSDSGSTDNNVTRGDATPHFSVLLSALRAPSPKNANLLSVDVPVIPIVVYTGPTRVPGAPVPVEPSPKIKVAAHARPKAKPGTKPKAEQ
jgi:D-alanyl-D-alanine carboxypeptidase